MKICLINNLYKPFNRGGAESVVELMAEGLNRAGHKVFIITTKPRFSKQTAESPLRRSCSEASRRQKEKRGLTSSLEVKPHDSSKRKIYYLLGVYYHLNKIPKSLRIFWHLWDMFNVINYFKVKKIFKRELPDVVITHNLKGVGYSIPLAIKQFKIKHCHYLHDIQLIHPSGLMIYGQEEKINRWPAKIYQAICRRMFGSPEVVISPSRWLLNFHEQKGFFRTSKKVVLVNPTSPYPLLIRRGSPEWRGEADKKVRGGSEPFCFLFVGQIEQHKGILFLIHAFNQIKEKNCELLIVGVGSLLDRARKLARENNEIKFLGWKNIDEMWQSADCLIVPSLCYENSPMTIIKAVTQGIPVIASDIGGIPELLASGAGILFRPADRKDLLAKMKWALNNKNGLRKISQGGINKSERFNADKFIDKLIELIK